MLNVERVTLPIMGAKIESPYFRPLEAYLNQDYQEDAKVEEDGEVTIEIDAKCIPTRIEPSPCKRLVVTLDSTSRILGYTEDGVVGAIRAAIIKKTPEGKIELERYGPYLLGYTNQNKADIYRELQLSVFGKTPRSRAPNLDKIVERTRNLLEEWLQLEIATNYEDALLLFDGALTSGTIDSPKSFRNEILREAAKRSNDIVSIAKKTSLTLTRTREGVGTILGNVSGPCFVSIKPLISQSLERYEGIQVYVAKLTPAGEAFRIDIPTSAVNQHEQVLSEVCGLAGDYGYVEELRLAHIYCILTTIEAIELQSAAIAKYGLQLKEDELRKKLFGPYGG